MRSFPSTDLKQKLGNVLDAANQGPVEITRHSTPRYVLMSIHDYNARFKTDQRQSIATDNMPDEHLEMIESALTEDTQS